MRGELAVAAVDDAGRITHRERERPAAAAAVGFHCAFASGGPPAELFAPDDGDGARKSSERGTVSQKSAPF